MALIIQVSKFVLIPGAGGMAWYWHRVIPELSAAATRRLLSTFRAMTSR